MGGPLSSIKVLEFAGLAPVPFAATMLADMGADVLRVERLPREVSPIDPAKDMLRRGRPWVALDLKSDDGRDAAAALAASADVLIEGFRPGVMERLGLGPEALCEANPRLVYARMTGWGQAGPLAERAGHDINYLALTGALHAIGPADRPPPPPLNLVGDFGGGGMLVLAGILAALVERGTSGRGQVVDAAMVDGAALLMAQVASLRAGGLWSDRRGANLLDGGAYFYRCYETADGGFVAVGAIEPQFHAALVAGLGLEPKEFGEQMNPALWPERSERLAAVFRKRSRAEWEAHFAGTDACVTPVLSMDEAPRHPANAARGAYLAEGPAPAPRFGRTPSRAGAIERDETDVGTVLARWRTGTRS